MKYTFELDDEHISDLFVQVLKENIDLIFNFWEADAEKLIKAHLKVIEYMSVPSEGKEYAKEIKQRIKERA